MRLLPFALALVLAAGLSACTWVKMEPGAGAVQVAHRADDLSACTKRGEVGVTVKDKVGLYRRNELKVRDELETMARNEARSLGADTVQALNDPSAGEQRFAAYACGAQRAAPRRATPEAEPTATLDGEARTYPLREE